MLQRLLERFLPAERLSELSQYLPRRIIAGGDGTPYLSRFRVFDLGKSRCRLFLHCFHRGDEDREVHSHPWAWAYSLILAGNYTEERLRWNPLDGTPERSIVFTTPDGVTHTTEERTYKTGDLNTISTQTFHRVRLKDGIAWSLILTGPIVQSWGFYDTRTNTYTGYKAFLRQKGIVEDDDGAPSFSPPLRQLPWPQWLGAISRDLRYWWGV